MKKPGWLDEFKVFISRGNVIDLAVGVVVGGAFTAIVTALVNDIINPLISLIIGGLDFSGLNIGVFPIGDLIMSIINFLCISLVVFWMVKIIKSCDLCNINFGTTRKKRSPNRKPRPSRPRTSCWRTFSPSSSCKMAAPRPPRHWTPPKRKNLPLRSDKITLDNPRLICYSI